MKEAVYRVTFPNNKKVVRLPLESTDTTLTNTYPTAASFSCLPFAVVQSIRENNRRRICLSSRQPLLLLNEQTFCQLHTRTIGVYCLRSTSQAMCHIHQQAPFDQSTALLYAQKHMMLLMFSQAAQTRFLFIFFKRNSDTTHSRQHQQHQFWTIHQSGK